MKKCIKLILSLIIIFNLISCEDYLKEEPKDLLVETNFLNSEDDAVAAVTGVYLKFHRQGGYVYGRWPAFKVIEMTSKQYCDNNGQSTLDRGTYNSGQGDIGDLWEGYYAIISRANFVMAKMEESNLANKEEIIAETKFLRAYCYLCLVNLWGDVPLRSEAITSGEPDVVQIPATDKEEIYATVIFPDLIEAAQNLPATREDKADKFRVTSIAAQTLLARAYLYHEDWQQALDAADKAWSDGVVAGYGLFDNFMKTWGANYAGGKEQLFWINMYYEYDGDLVNRFLSPSNNNITQVRGWGNNRYVEPRFHESWPDDFRKLSSAPLGSYNDNGEFIPFASGQAHGAKLWDPLTPSGWGGANKNILRFAEVYLVYAEAANEVNGGPTAKAIEALNTIRQRARNFYELDYLGDGALIEANRDVPGLEDVDPANPPSQAEFRDMVYNDRDWELFFEFSGRFEEVRRHRMAMRGEIDSKYLLENVLSEFGTNIDNDIHGLLPIPQRELRLNPKLQQNIGY